MISTREKRLKKIEQALGTTKPSELPFTFIDFLRYEDEPDTFIMGASIDNSELNWQRQENEGIEAFKERIKQDVIKKIGPSATINFKRDYTGLSKPSEMIPRIFSVSREAIKRLKEDKI